MAVTVTVKAILAQAMQLSPTERADSADLLWSSVHSREEVDAAWEAKIAERVAQFDAGEVECRPLDDVLAELRKKLRTGARKLSRPRIRRRWIASR